MKHDNFDFLVIDIVQSALDNQDVIASACMYFGSLFVTCNGHSAQKIRSALKDRLGCGVTLSKIGPEYSFDFIE